MYCHCNLDTFVILRSWMFFVFFIAGMDKMRYLPNTPIRGKCISLENHTNEECNIHGFVDHYLSKCMKCLQFFSYFAMIKSTDAQLTVTRQSVLNAFNESSRDCYACGLKILQLCGKQGLAWEVIGNQIIFMHLMCMFVITKDNSLELLEKFKMNFGLSRFLEPVLIFEQDARRIARMVRSCIIRHIERWPTQECNLTAQILLEAISMSGGVCELCGDAIDTEVSSGPKTLSLDRKDPDQGYTLDNVLTCCWGCNQRKSFATIAECQKLLELAQAGTERKTWELRSASIDEIKAEEEACFKEVHIPRYTDAVSRSAPLCSLCDELSVKHTCTKLRELIELGCVYGVGVVADNATLKEQMELNAMRAEDSPNHAACVLKAPRRAQDSMTLTSGDTLDDFVQQLRELNAMRAEDRRELGTMRAEDCQTAGVQELDAMRGDQPPSAEQKRKRELEAADEASRRELEERAATPSEPSAAAAPDPEARAAPPKKKRKVQNKIFV